MIRRLAHFYVDNYGGEGDALGTDGQPVAGADGPVQAEELTSLVNDYELWFVVVANPDGYDFTFTPGNRLWRKNLRDNDGDGEIVIGDGVDLNRNFAEKWNYDDEGSSSDPANDTYRGTEPNSEPETQAMDGLLRDVGFEFMVNYHSAAELLLYPFGWQVQTTAADDPIFRALSGTDADPAIAGVEPGAPEPVRPGCLVRALHDERRDHRPRLQPLRHAGVDAGDGRLRPRARRRRQRVHVPGLGGRPPGRVREERPVRARRGPFGRRPGEPRLAPRPRGRGIRGRPLPDLVRRPAAGRSAGQARARRRDDQLAGQQRRAAERGRQRSSTTASAMARTATSTTRGSVAR